jgi:hypothetical protein
MVGRRRASFSRVTGFVMRVILAVGTVDPHM